MLVPEDNNPYDANAVAVWIEGLKAGHLSRADARAYRPGLLALQQRYRQPRARRVPGGPLERVNSSSAGLLTAWAMRRSRSAVRLVDQGGASRAMAMQPISSGRLAPVRRRCAR
jgi:hypothetical protein